MQGYVKLYRKTMCSPIWQDPYYFKLWMYCLMKASHKEHDQIVGSQLVKLEPGQFVTGRTSLAEDLNKGVKPKLKQSELSWWRYLNNLEKWEMLNIKKTNKYSVVTVVKWSEYQESEQQVNNSCTSVEHQLNTNKNVKNGKNEKNEVNNIYNHWNSKEIIIHRSLSQKAKSHINARLGDYSEDELLKAIDNYNTILTGDKYYWSHKWTLQDFMKPNNMIRFLEDSEPLKTFLKGGQAGGQNGGAFGRNKTEGRKYEEESERERPSFIKSV